MCTSARQGCWPARPGWPSKPPSVTRTCAQASDLARRLRELRRSVVEREAHLVAVQDELDADRAEIDRIDLREGHQAAATEADRSAMATRRWADAAPSNGGQ